MSHSPLRTLLLPRAARVRRSDRRVVTGSGVGGSPARIEFGGRGPPPRGRSPKRGQRDCLLLYFRPTARRVSMLRPPAPPRREAWGYPRFRRPGQDSNLRSLSGSGFQDRRDTELRDLGPEFHRARSIKGFPPKSSERTDVNLERANGMAELVGIDHSGMDLPEDANRTPVDRDARASPRDVIGVR